MYRILVVEDERPISDLIEMNLSEAGYTCVCAYDGWRRRTCWRRRATTSCSWTLCAEGEPATSCSTS